MLTLSSDFGSPYPAAMKGVILDRTDASLVDVAHDLPRQDVRSAAFWLREILPYFPPAVHLAVIDPGVGTDRRAIAIRAGGHALVGPDNGVIRPAARALVEHADSAGADADDPAVDTFELTGFDPESSTFHGRDVFAPAAALVHEIGIDEIDDNDRFSPIEDPVELRFQEPEVSESGADGVVLAVDDFGNVITNVPGHVLADHFGEPIAVNDRAVPAARTYAECDAGDPLATVGSHGNVELAVRAGRGDVAFGLAPGALVELQW